MHKYTHIDPDHKRSKLSDPDLNDWKNCSAVPHDAAWLYLTHCLRYRIDFSSCRGPPRILCHCSTTRLWRFRVLMSCAFIWVKWSCITKRFFISSLERFLITLIFVSVSRNFAMTERGPPLFPPGTLCMDKMSDASRSMLIVSLRNLQRSCSLSCQLVN